MYTLKPNDYMVIVYSSHATTPRARLHTHTHTHTHARALTNTHTHTHTHTHTRIHAHTHACALTNTRTHAHARARAHTHTHTHTLTRTHIGMQRGGREGKWWVQVRRQNFKSLAVVLFVNRWGFMAVLKTWED